MSLYSKLFRSPHTRGMDIGRMAKYEELPQRRSAALGYGLIVLGAICLLGAVLTGLVYWFVYRQGFAG